MDDGSQVTLMCFMNADKKLGVRGTKVLMAEGSQVEDIRAIRDNDHLYIC